MLIRYFKHTWRRNLLDLLFFFIFWAIFRLSHIAIEDWLYPTVLCIACFLGYSILDYLKFRRKLLEIQLSIESQDFQTERFVAEDEVQKEYHRLIASMNALKQSQMEALRSSRHSYKEYLMLWSHQIKTPLTALGLLVQKLENPLPYREQLLYIQSYVDMMLRFLKLDSIQNDLHIQEVSLQESIYKSLRYLRPLFITSKTSVNIQDCGISVRSDPSILDFVLEQLLSNAIKYGGKQVNIYVEDGTLVIADQGLGIDPAYLPLIWKKGFSTPNRTLGQKSSGIGLYLVHEMLQALNHSISVESEKNKGAKFKITF